MLDQGPVLAISTERAVSPKKTALETAVLCKVDVRVPGPDAALPQRLELRQTGIQLSCRPLPTFRLVSVRAMVLNIGTLVVGLDSDLASFMIAWSGGSINGD